MNITYQVKYRLKNQLFFRTVENVEGDIIPMATSQNPVRVLFISDKSTIEIPVVGTVFRFSKERFYSQKEKMSNEIGQPIQTS